MSQVSQNIVGPKMILAECSRKYNDPKLGQRKKSSCLKMAKDCILLLAMIMIMEDRYASLIGEKNE